LTVLVGETLEVALSVANTGRDPFVYDDCFHTYFAVGDAASCVVGGLDGVGYIDRGKADARFVQHGELPITAELVHVHVKAPARSEIRDPVWKRRIVIEQSGMEETVVWNPGEATAAKNPEMAGRWKEFLCVESANCLDGNVTLLPGTSHQSLVKYRVEAL
jgi:glucose-6-phosphate 1-epimerase